MPRLVVRPFASRRLSSEAESGLEKKEGQARMARLNVQAEQAVRQGKDPMPARERTGKVQVYANVLSADRTMLLQS